MIARCNGTSSVGCKRWYVQKGIRVKFDDFEHFYSIVGPRPSPKHSIDRIDNNGHYEPGNCRWATQSDQVRNSSKAKLTKEQVEEIKGLKLRGFSKHTIAEIYGIHHTSVNNIYAGRTWA